MSWLVCQREEGVPNEGYAVAVKTDAMRTVQINPLLCAFLRKKNALSWISHYSGSACGCGRLLNFSEFISNFIHMVHIVNIVQRCSHRAIQYIISK